MATVSWTFPINGDWSDSGNWTPTGPGPGDDAVIGATPGSYIVSVTGATFVHSVSLAASGATLAVGSALTIGALPTVVTPGTLSVTAGTVRLAAGGSIIGGPNGGTIAVNGGSVVFAGGTLNGVTWLSPLTMTGSNAALTLTGSVAVTGTAGVTVAGLNDSLTVLGTLATSAGLSINAGSVQVWNGGHAAIGASSTSEATFELHNGADASVNGDYVNNGMLAVDAGNGESNSSLTVTGTLTNNKTVQAGNSGGTKLILGGLVNPSGKNFTFTLGTLSFTGGPLAFTQNGGAFCP
ncbi:MAG: hypothetical protein U1E70_18075 [Acetobacteraceae bacterium]